MGSVHQHGDKSYIVALADNFGYTDPIDGSVATKQVPSVDFFLSFLFLGHSLHNISCFLMVSVVAVLSQATLIGYFDF